MLGREVKSVAALVQLGQSLKRPGWLTLVGADSKGTVRAVGDAPSEILRKNYLFLAASVRKFMRQSGSHSVFLVGDDGDVADVGPMGHGHCRIVAAEPRQPQSGQPRSTSPSASTAICERPTFAGEEESIHSCSAE
mgnify:CR=1 FL=1